MKIQIETNNHIGSQLINICKKFGVEFTVKHDSSLDFVDLGLPSGLKWATCNVGAKTPTECGNYFRWGEVIDAREMGRNSNYDYNKSFEDAATYHMGKQWRMPTNEELQELCDNTRNEWVKNYQGSDVSGRLFTSKVNGQTLFFPAAGYYSSSSVYSIRSSAHVWSSSLDISNPYYAYILYSNSSYVGSQNGNFRCIGRSVRGVRG